MYRYNTIQYNTLCVKNKLIPLHDISIITEKSHYDPYTLNNGRPNYIRSN